MNLKRLCPKFFKNPGQNLKNRDEIRCVSTLKLDLARFKCGMSMVDGALKHPCVVLSNSKIKSGA